MVKITCDTCKAVKPNNGRLHREEWILGYDIESKSSRFSSARDSFSGQVGRPPNHGARSDSLLLYRMQRGLPAEVRRIAANMC